MRVALDGIPLTLPKTGVGHYTSELGVELARNSPETEFQLVSPRPANAHLVEELNFPANLKAVNVPIGPLTRHWWSIGLPRYLKRQQVDLFHGTNYDIPLRRTCPTVLTVHDLSLLLLPKTHEARRVRRARRLLKLMARIATVVITPSLAVHREACELLRLPANKVFIIPYAPRKSFTCISASATEPVRRRLGLNEDFVLTVATIEPRKNLITLVRAFTTVMRESSRPLKLAIVGQQGWLSEPFLTEIATLPSRERIVLTGYLPDSDLAALYSSCLLFVYPSIYEGFGLPPLEAMACGAPVVASSIASLIESTGGAAHFFDPKSEEELARAILSLTEDPAARKEFSVAGTKQVANYSWSRTAEMTLEVYAEAIRRFRA